MSSNGDNPDNDLARELVDRLEWIDELDERTRKLVDILIEDGGLQADAITVAHETLIMIANRDWPLGVAVEQIARVALKLMDEIATAAIEQLKMLEELR